ncbi:MAG: leucyl/phenylalanyl-tRNA--protein transferase [Bacteroidetes bacterium]|nr:leucyl/phenylalanyl-tRNA--protein transferase [Bacteroidota bacterium]
MISVELLVQAYLSGSFPMADPDEGDQIYWHTPETRGLIPLDDTFKVPKNLMRLYKKEKFELTINRAFPEVIEQCSLLRQGDTWISEEIIAVYTEMHKLGLAHSFEVWLDGVLVGGLYGVAIGKAFFGESMFHTVSDASKIALVFLVEFLQEQNFQLLDCQYLNPHLLQFGAYEVTQEEFLSRLQEIIHGIS